METASYKITEIKPAELISVIIPVYNAENTIEKALRSVVCQSKGNFEIIIINDGSTDASLDIIYRFKKINTHIHITVIDKIHEGVSATRNAGLKLAKGNYIAFLDADDEWHADKTLKQLNVLTTNSADFIGCLGQPLKNKPGTNWLKYVHVKEMLFKNFFQTSGVIMKRKAFETVGFFEDAMLYGEDRHYFLRVNKLFTCILLNENLFTYGNGKRGFGEEGLSAKLLQMQLAELKNLAYAFKNLGMPFITCCQATAFSILKFLRRLYIVYVVDSFRFLRKEIM